MLYWRLLWILGVGGNAIQFAFTCERVIAIDIGLNPRPPNTQMHMYYLLNLCSDKHRLAFMLTCCSRCCLCLWPQPTGHAMLLVRSCAAGVRETQRQGRPVLHPFIHRCDLLMDTTDLWSSGSYGVYSGGLHCSGPGPQGLTSALYHPL